MSRSIHAIGSFGTLARRVSWVPAAAVIALPFFTPGSPVSLVRVAVEQSQQLTITGSVDGLRPGVAADLTLTLDNRSDEPSTVHSVGVRVTGATSGCPLAALSARSWTGVLVVPAHGVATAVVPVTLTDSAGECAGTTWQLAYTSS